MEEEKKKNGSRDGGGWRLTRRAESKSDWLISDKPDNDCAAVRSPCFQHALRDRRAVQALLRKFILFE